MINAIILSKDKACQLDLLIESISKNCKNIFNIKVIYESSNSSFELGYNKLKEKLYYKNRFGLDFPIRWYERKNKNLSQDILNTLDDSVDLTCLLNDENIFFSNFGSYKSILNLFRKEPLASLSLRLGDNTVIQNPYSIGRYFIDKPEKFSLIDNKFIGWDASLIKPFTNFGMPFSHNGHVYTTKLLKHVLSVTEIDEIDSLEKSIQQNLYSGVFASSVSPFMACLKSSVVVTNSATALSDPEDFEQIFDTSLFSVNERYLHGYKIDYDFFNFSNISKPFQQHVTRFRRENNMQYGR